MARKCKEQKESAAMHILVLRFLLLQQFKAKFVIDALGIKMARNVGQGVNYLGNIIGRYTGHFASIVFINCFFVILPCIWLLVAYFVGSKYKKSIETDKVIT